MGVRIPGCFSGRIRLLLTQGLPTRKTTTSPDFGGGSSAFRPQDTDNDRYVHHYPESLRDGVEGLDRLKKEHVTNLSQSNEKGGNQNGYPLDLFGGADRIRTGDLRVANASLSQLSHSPALKKTRFVKNNNVKYNCF